jgi:predicted nucleic acid-binding protein
MLNTGDVIVIDADAFIAYFDREDEHAQKTIHILENIAEHEATILYPSTVVAEATTTLQRKLGKPMLVAAIMERVKAHKLLIEPVDQAIIDEAAAIFKPHGSKQNTLFDAIVAAVAKKHHARAVFSFDEWYQKVGLSLVNDVL